MKKKFTPVLAFVLCMSLMGGCGSSTSSSGTSSAVSSGTSKAVSEASSSESASSSPVSSKPASSASDSSKSSSSASSNSSAKPTEDRSGNKITVPDKVGRIISMSPASTEMLDDLGLAGSIIACDTQSPKYVSDLPSGIPQFDMMTPDNEQIVALKPDIVFTTGMSSHGGTDVYQSARDAGICVAEIPSSTSISAIQDDIRFVAACTGAADGGKKIIDTMQSGIDEVSAIGSKITDQKSVLFEISGSPKIYSAGKDTFIDEMITLIGARNVTGDQKSWIALTDEAAIAANPDVILTGANTSDDPVGDILSLPGWENVTAVRNKAVAYIDNASIMIPSENIVEGLREMAVAVYPDAYASVAEEITGNDAAA